MTESQINQEASALGRRGGMKGGRARAERLTAEQRRQIALNAAASRWGTVHVATHSGELVIGDMTLACAVLEDGTRVLSQSTVLSALGRHPHKSRRTGSRGSELKAPFLLANNLQVFISEELSELAEPIGYRVKGESARSWGYRAEMLPMVCDAYLAARQAGVLVPQQRAAANAAEVLVRGLARVGIVALVDEATGYQETRERQELQRLLEAFVAAELRPWVKTFPDEFFREIYRLHGWEYKGTSKRTPQVGKLVNKYIYEQLPEGVLEELQRRNPRNEKGYRAHKHFQLLTEGTGNPHLDRQISTVTTLMRISDDKAQFEILFERAFPPPQPRLPLEVVVEETSQDD